MAALEIEKAYKVVFLTHTSVTGKQCVNVTNSTGSRPNYQSNKDTGPTWDSQDQRHGVEG